MGNFEQFWARIVRANPGFGHGDSVKVTMTIGEIRKLIRKAHTDGFHCGLQASRIIDNIGKQSMGDILDAKK